MASLSRKEFLRLAAAGMGAVVGGRFLAACGQAPTEVSTLQTATASSVSTGTATATALATATSTSTPLPLHRPDIIKFFPMVPSRVVQTHHAGVWQGETLQPEVLKQMLDRSITRLTGVDDALSAWKALFAPTEKVAIKVNTLPYGKYWTHVPLVMAVAERLQEAGVAAEQIIIYDRDSSDLTVGGYTINKDGPGVRCYGNDSHYASGYNIGGISVGLSEIMLGCDALINIPILKTHTMDGAGMSFSMKNHYGTIDQPQNFHGEILLDAIPAINAFAPIQEKTRLNIGDGLKIIRDDWFSAFDSDFISMSFDPVAHDTVGLKVLTEAQAANGLQPEPTRARASAWLRNAARLGIGTDQMGNIEFMEERMV